MAEGTRRKVLMGLGGGALALVGGGAALMAESDRGAAHNAYFTALSDALKRNGFWRPTLVIDKMRLEANAACAKNHLTGKPLALRVVAKSLPASELIEAVAKGVGSRSVMAFNGAMVAELASKGFSDILMGKPLPVAAAHEVIKAISPAVQPQWLIDTPERLAQYAALASGSGQPLRVNFEIDVGLRRGGFATAEALAAALDTAMANPKLTVSGLMGYDAHVVKGLSRERALRASRATYASMRAVMLAKTGKEAQSLTLNTGGSPTYQLHLDNQDVSEVAVGSAFVKPTDFDIDTLADHQPAVFIATPVLKALPRADIPSIEFLTGLVSTLNPNREQAFFIHGGHWLATPESPPGLRYNGLYGRSSNQEMLNGSRKVALKPDDFIFLRPTQSEAVLMQFGDLAVFDGKDIVGTWPTFPVSA